MKISDMTSVDLYCVIMLAFVLVAGSRFIYEAYKEPGRSRVSRGFIWLGVFIIYLFPAAYGTTALWR